jgi:NAD(P)-dependent dehydrogenase (short-subunit alcohol dehydrogenase family)
VTPVQLDIADLASVTAAAAKGVSILVNNAGIETGATRLNGDPGDIRREFDTNFFGSLTVTRAFAPQLGEHEESYILNVLSVLSWLNRS